MSRYGDWEKARRLLGSAPRRIERAMRRAVAQEAHLYRREIVDGMTAGQPGGKPFKPLEPVTIAVRRLRGMRGTKALIARGDLRRAIQVISTPRGEHFIGVLRTARGRDGQQLANVAAVHEFGKTVVMRLSGKARAFLAMAYRKANPGGSGASAGKTGVVVIRIPARPFLRPVFDKLNPGSARRVLRRTAKLLAGDFGAVL